MFLRQYLYRYRDAMIWCLKNLYRDIVSKFIKKLISITRKNNIIIKFDKVFC